MFLLAQGEVLGAQRSNIYLSASISDSPTRAKARDSLGLRLNTQSQLPKRPGDLEMLLRYNADDSDDRAYMSDLVPSR